MKRTPWDYRSDELLSALLSSNPVVRDLAGDECQSRGLMPVSVLNALGVFHFLVEAVVPAQVAARMYGLRPSVLLAIARLRSGFDAGDYARDNGHPLMPGSPASVRAVAIEQAFITEAKGLAKDRRLRPAMEVADDPSAYLEKLCKLGWCNAHELRDFLALVNEDDFRSCDHSRGRRADRLVAAEIIKQLTENQARGGPRLVQ